MMSEHNDCFIADEVDEQIEHFSHSPNLHRAQESSLSGAQLVQHLRDHYQTGADAMSLARVGERLRRRERTILAPGDEILQDLDRRESEWVERGTTHNHTLSKVRRRKLPYRLSMIAAVVFLALLVSSMVIVLNLARSGRSGTTPPTGNTADASSVYTLLGDAVYKVDLKSGTIAWTKAIPSTSGYSGGNLAVSNGMVYFSISLGPEYAAVPYIYALRASDGSQVWRTPLDPGLVTAQVPQPYPPAGIFTAKFDLGFTTQPIVANGMVYVAARTGKVYALDAATGARHWMYDTHLTAVKCVGEQGQKNYDCFFTTEPTVSAVDRGVVYGAIQNEVYALDAESGSKLWATHIHMSQVIASHWVVSNSTLYAISEVIQIFYIGSSPQYSYMYAFDAKTGIQQWVTSRFTGFSTDPEIVQGVVYLGSQDGTLYAFNGNGGSLLWRKSLGAPMYFIPADTDSTIYVQTDKLGSGQVGQHTPVTTTLFALKVSDGAIRWHIRIDRNGWAGEVLSVSQGVIYVLTEVDSNITSLHPSFHLFLDAYSASDGHKLWSKSL